VGKNEGWYTHTCEEVSRSDGTSEVALRHCRLMRATVTLQRSCLGTWGNGMCRKPGITPNISLRVTNGHTPSCRRSRYLKGGLIPPLQVLPFSIRTSRPALARPRSGLGYDRARRWASRERGVRPTFAGLRITKTVRHPNEGPAVT